MIEIDEEKILMTLYVATSSMDDFKGVAEALYARIMGWTE